MNAQGVNLVHEMYLLKKEIKDLRERIGTLQTMIKFNIAVFVILIASMIIPTLRLW
jgi:hypothetical protein